MRGAARVGGVSTWYRKTTRPGGRALLPPGRIRVKGLLLAGGCLMFLVGACAAALRVYRGDREYQVFLGALAGSVVLYAALFRALPADLGFLPRGAAEPAASVDFWNGLLVLALVTHGIWTFAYMVWTGPTMRVLLAADRARGRGLTESEVLRRVDGGDRTGALLRRRLQKLVRGGYIREDNEAYTLLPRGRAAGRIVVRVKQAVGDWACPAQPAGGRMRCSKDCS